MTDTERISIATAGYPSLEFAIYVGCLLVFWAVAIVPPLFGFWPALIAALPATGLSIYIILARFPYQISIDTVELTVEIKTKRSSTVAPLASLVGPEIVLGTFPSWGQKLLWFRIRGQVRQYRMTVDSEPAQEFIREVERLREAAGLMSGSWVKSHPDRLVAFGWQLFLDV